MRCVFVYMVLVMVGPCVRVRVRDSRISFQLRFVFVIWREYVLGGIGTSAIARTRPRTTNQWRVVQYAVKKPVADVNGCLMQVQIHFTHTHTHTRKFALSHFTIFLLALSLNKTHLQWDYTYWIERAQNHTCEMSQQAAASDIYDAIISCNCNDSILTHSKWPCLRVSIVYLSVCS